MNIFRFFRKKEAPTGGTNIPTDADLERLVSTSYRHATGALPDTKNQWTRLERSIGNQSESVRTRPPARVRLATPRFAYVAVAIVAIALLVINLPLNRPAKIERFTTLRGEQSEFVLPDSSVVVLNHTSSLQFEPSGFADLRNVTLSGEAYFSVRKDGAPFVVTTDAGSVTVTGTKFNVRVRNGHYEFGVTEGSINTTVPAPGHDTTLALVAGEALAGTRGAEPMPVRKIAHASYPGWTRQTLIFTSMDLASVCTEIQNAFDVRIRLEDPAMGSVSVSGAFDAREVRGVISSICALTGRNYRYETGTYILY